MGRSLTSKSTKGQSGQPAPPPAWALDGWLQAPLSRPHTCSHHEELIPDASRSSSPMKDLQSVPSTLCLGCSRDF